MDHGCRQKRHPYVRMKVVNIHANKLSPISESAMAAAGLGKPSMGRLDRCGGVDGLDENKSYSRLCRRRAQISAI
jgi:hypothetical protein